MSKNIDEIKYLVPAWCKMPKAYHNDGIGGCWGISHGFVKREGESYCKECEYHQAQFGGNK